MFPKKSPDDFDLHIPGGVPCPGPLHKRAEASQPFEQLTYARCRDAGPEAILTYGDIIDYRTSSEGYRLPE